MSANDRDELIVELLSKIILRLDTIEDGMGKAKEASPKPIDPTMFGDVVTVLGNLKTHTASMDAKTRSSEQNDDAIRTIVRKEIREPISPVLAHICKVSMRFQDEHRERGERIVSLERVNRTWLWAAPALALATIVVFVLAARLAMNTAIGCTALGGKYEATGRGFVDLCFFAAGGWW